MRNEHGLRHAGYHHLAEVYYRECFCGWGTCGPDHGTTIKPFNAHIDAAIGDEGQAFARFAVETVAQPLFAAAFWATLRGVALNTDAYYVNP